MNLPADVTQAPKQSEPDFSVLAADAMRSKQWIIILLSSLVVLLLWAGFARLDVVSIAQGEVIPADKVQSIAHLEGGVIHSMLVKQGDVVEAGQALVELESTASGASVAELSLKLDSLKADVWRMDAELNNAEALDFATAPKVSEQLLLQASALFRSRRDNLRNDIDVQAAEITRREQSLNLIGARIQNHSQRLTLLEEQIAISDNLVKQEIASRYEHINLLKEASGLRSQIEEDKEALLGAKAEIAQASSAAANIPVEYRRELNELRDESVRSLNELSERYKKLADDLSRTVLTAPVSGVVKQVYLFTRGGVVSPGQTVLDIVPDKSRIVVEARLPPQDIGYVDVGAQALIRLNSADSIKFEALEGQVITISPDTVVDENGNAYYVTQIATEQNYFSSAEGNYPLVPGVMVTSGIVLGKRTILEYIFSPFLSSSTFALSER